MNPVIALARAEVLQLLRNKTTASMVLVLPIVFAAMFLFGSGEQDWDLAITMLLVGAQALSVYISSTAAIAARRQDLSLKRFRAGELPDLAILAGVLSPFAVIGLAQSVLLTGVVFAAGAPVPGNPLGLVIAIVGGVAVNAAVGLLTAAFTASAEAAQITTAPFFFAALGGAIWALTTGSPWATALPGGAIAALVGGEDVLRPLASLVVWTVVAAALGLRHTKWDPRD
ncbi:ABC transporter permease [Actinokineospora cianjurensis]|uniref:ABC-2 type transport system permease protein n=1 Tax=Actinokineospora cianjurensis TaxID=585224 RepID=A0A421B4E4_9PSEU|nr:ABC transporter permease [Actinokineospora cianjurensis]RLK59229.1 ABC-2 type transport system permease protein [Actinokineospora cianjurensis]